MSLSGKTIAITGAGRSLGAALAILAADRGALPILLGRTPANLEEIAAAIAKRTGTRPVAIACDLADATSVASAADKIAVDHPNLDVLVNSGAHWIGGAFEALDDAAIESIIGSAVTGTIQLTRRLLPLLRARPHADLHTVVSMSGLQYARLRGSSLPFRAAKSAQDGFVQALTEELIGTSVRVTASYPGHIEDMLPVDPAWDEPRGPNNRLTDRNVAEAILYILEAPRNVAIRSLVIEQARTEFLS